MKILVAGIACSGSRPCINKEVFNMSIFDLLMSG